MSPPNQLQNLQKIVQSEVLLTSLTESFEAFHSSLAQLAGKLRLKAVPSPRGA